MLFVVCVIAVRLLLLGFVIVVIVLIVVLVIVYLLFAYCLLLVCCCLVLLLLLLLLNGSVFANNSIGRVRLRPNSQDEKKKMMSGGLNHTYEVLHWRNPARQLVLHAIPPQAERCSTVVLAMTVG